MIAIPRVSFRLAHTGRAMAAAAGVALLLVGGCSALKPEASPTPPTYFTLDGKVEAGAGAAPGATRSPRKTRYTLIVTPPQAAAGFDSPRIIYMRQPYKLEYFAHNEWVDPPARMISPQMVAAIEATSAFHAVVSAPGSSGGDMRLDTEVLVLQQEFGASPSKVRFALRAALSEEGTRRVIATRDFEAVQPALSDDPYGGVQAANAVVRSVLASLAAFCADNAVAWQPASRPVPAR
ncbi:MAG: ABC-type transport auxiliary lipoprotein family protein [Betaproteobacteria bacterium]